MALIRTSACKSQHLHNRAMVTYAGSDKIQQKYEKKSQVPDGLVWVIGCNDTELDHAFVANPVQANHIRRLYLLFVIGIGRPRGDLELDLANEAQLLWSWIKDDNTVPTCPMKQILINKIVRVFFLYARVMTEWEHLFTILNLNYNLQFSCVCLLKF